MSTTWYKTWRYNIDIKPVEVVSETKEFVTLKAEAPSGWNPNPQPRRARKDDEYHRTFAEARTFLMDRNTAEFKGHAQAIEKLRIEAGKIFMMEPPK